MRRNRIRGRIVVGGLLLGTCSLAGCVPEARLYDVPSLSYGRDTGAVVNSGLDTPGYYYPGYYYAPRYNSSAYDPYRARCSDYVRRGDGCGGVAHSDPGGDQDSARNPDGADRADRNQGRRADGDGSRRAAHPRAGRSPGRSTGASVDTPAGRVSRDDRAPTSRSGSAPANVQTEPP